MNIEERKKYFKNSIKWESETPRIGGQSCGIQYFKTSLICEELDFQICINHFRSQLKNKELMFTLFELYLDEIIK